MLSHLAGPLEDGRGGVAVELGLGEDGGGDGEALAAVRYVERGDRRVMRHLLRDVERLKRSEVQRTMKNSD